MTSPKRMAWKDKWLSVLAQNVVGDTDKDTLATFPDQTTPTELTVTWTQEEYTRILSSLIIGAEFAYPDASKQVFYDFLKIVNGGAMSCEDVADCFEAEIINNTTLQNAVDNYILSSGFGNTNRVNPTLTTPNDRNKPNALDKPISEQSECNLDKLWGGIRYGIVQRLDDNARTVLENLAAINDVPERFQTLLDIIPVLGDVAESFVTNLTQVIPDLKNLYEAHSSEENLDEWACGLYNLVCSECRYPTYTEVFNYAKNLGIAGIPDVLEITAQIFVDFWTGSAATAANVAYFTTQVVQLSVLYLQASFNGQTGTETLYEYATLGEDFASDNWLQLCDECGEQYMEYVWDFTQAQFDSYRTDGFSGNISSGNYVAGRGWRLSSINATDGLMQVGLAIDPTWQIVAVAYKSTAAAGAQVAAFRTTPSASGGQTVNLNAADAPYTQRANMILNPQTNRNEFALRLAATLASNLYLEKIAMRFNAGFAPSGSTPVVSPNFAP